MKCPFCSELKDRVVDSRESRDGHTVRRRRECLSCGRRFTTYEQIEDIPYMVVKNDGSRQDFDRRKLLVGLHKACEKRPVSARSLQEIVDSVEHRLHEQEDRELSTEEIGNLVMARLKKLEFAKLQTDPWCFMRSDEEGTNCIISIYVDDLIIAGRTLAIVDEFKRKLSEAFKCKDLGEAN